MANTGDQLIRAVQKLLRPVTNRVNGLVLRGAVALVNDELKMQGLQVTLRDGETKTAEHFQPYGFAFRPFKGAEVVALNIGGSPAHPVIVAASDRARRMHLDADGEAAIYRFTEAGEIESFVHLKTGGNIHVKCGTKVTVEAPDTEFTGNLKVDGKLDCTGNITGAAEVADANGPMSEMRTTYNGHTHPGVTAGGASTGTTPAAMG